jgi:hypothetical protein
MRRIRGVGHPKDDLTNPVDLMAGEDPRATDEAILGGSGDAPR